MPTQRLQTLLKQLAEEVEQLGDSKKDEKARLESLISDIETTLEHDSSEDHASFLEGLRARLNEFEASHPTTSGVAQRLVQALSDMGI